MRLLLPLVAPADVVVLRRPGLVAPAVATHPGQQVGNSPAAAGREAGRGGGHRERLRSLLCHVPARGWPRGPPARGAPWRAAWPARIDWPNWPVAVLAV